MRTQIIDLIWWFVLKVVTQSFGVTAYNEAFIQVLSFAAAAQTASATAKNSKRILHAYAEWTTRLYLLWLKLLTWGGVKNGEICRRLSCTAPLIKIQIFIAFAQLLFSIQNQKIIHILWSSLANAPQKIGKTDRLLIEITVHHT